MTIIFIHGIPETKEIWNPLLGILDREAVALALPGLGTLRPDEFTGTKDAYAEWLGQTLKQFSQPIDVVAHDLGALPTMRVASAFDGPLRSWTVDVANIFHPDFVWPERVHNLQIPGVGEEMLKTSREANPDDPQSTVSRLVRSGVPRDLANDIGRARNAVMSQSILDFYRSAVPNVGTDWCKDIRSPTRSQGPVLLLPDPPEAEAMSLQVANQLGAKTLRLQGLNHCWMAQAPDVVAPLLKQFWASLD